QAILPALRAWFSRDGAPQYIRGLHDAFDPDSRQDRRHSERDRARHDPGRTRGRGPLHKDRGDAKDRNPPLPDRVHRGGRDIGCEPPLDPSSRTRERMTGELPPGYLLRRPLDQDAEGVLALMIACDLVMLGEPDSTIDDVKAEWTMPRF